MRTRTLYMGMIAALIVVVGLVGCSKKPPPGEIIPPPEVTPSEMPQTERVPGDETAPPGSAAEDAALQIEDVFYEFDKYALTARARDTLTRDADVLLANPGMRLLIEGHCDERGTREYNLALADRRARASRDFLVAYGIDASRLETISYGEERPFVLGSTESAWSKNRRAHFVVRQ
ncbi:MAG: peptidoglycan-associated lipoprotein Pal [Candidatus Eisenbacteria sp.]|nr:peptidoglycan-associated lipoprotein Pal [Candidatus Eisenbacteria bacterium]